MTLIYILIFLVICFCIYKLLKRMSNKKIPLWNPEDESDLVDILSHIYSSATLENLKSVFAEGVRRRPKHHDLFKIAMEEKQQQITQNHPILSFETRESKARKIWILSFCTYYFLFWLAFVNFKFGSPTEGLLESL